VEILLPLGAQKRNPMNYSIEHIAIQTARKQPMDWAQYRGQYLLIVNVASACGYTPQYGQLQDLYTHFRDRLEIIGCPCNDFGAQEPGSETEILDFCKVNYGVDFTITEKVGILRDRHALYDWLCDGARNGVDHHEVAWNFHKFLINPDRRLVGSYASDIAPLDIAADIL
jgi:glutathione peroxidase